MEDHQTTLNNTVSPRMLTVAVLDLSSKKDKSTCHINPDTDVSQGPYNAEDERNATSEATRLVGGSSSTYLNLPNRAAQRRAASSSDRSSASSNVLMTSSSPIRYFYKVNNTVLPQWISYITPSSSSRRRQVINQAANWFPSIASSIPAWLIATETANLMTVLAGITTLLISVPTIIFCVVNYLKTHFFSDSSHEISEKMRKKETITDPYAIFSVYKRLRLQIVIELADNEVCHSYDKTFTNETTFILVPKPSANCEDQWSIILMPSDKSDFYDLNFQCGPCLFRPYSALKGFYKLSYFNDNNIENLLLETRWGPESLPGLVDLQLSYSPIQEFSLENFAETVNLLISNAITGTSEMFRGMTGNLETPIQPAVLITLTGKKRKKPRRPRRPWFPKLPFNSPSGESFPQPENPEAIPTGNAEPTGVSLFQKLKDWVGKNAGNRVSERLPEILFSFGAVTLVKFFFSQTIDPLNFFLPFLVLNEISPENPENGPESTLNQEKEDPGEIENRENSKNLPTNLRDSLISAFIVNTLIVIRFTVEKVFSK